jgi:hypothetical protein
LENHILHGVGPEHCRRIQDAQTSLRAEREFISATLAQRWLRPQAIERNPLLATFVLAGLPRILLAPRVSVIKLPKRGLRKETMMAKTVIVYTQPG